MVYVLLVFSLILIGILAILGKIYLCGKKYILDIDTLPKDCDTVIVLGAGIRLDWNPCDLLADRLSTGAEVYLKGLSNSILLTGDNSGDKYNELIVMKGWIIEHYGQYGVTEKHLLIDDYGYCTYESMYRAKNEFNIKKAIISTNRYHLPRAIYIARRLGIEAYGIPSDLRQYDRMKQYKRREILAQIKDFFLSL